MQDIDGKSVSTAQQALMGQAYGLKTGKLKPSDIKPKYRKEISNISKKMSLRSLKDFAQTKHKGLDHYVDEKSSELPVSLELIPSENMPIYTPHGPGKIVPFLDTDAKQKKKGKGNLQNLKDYRDWISAK